MSKKTKIPFNPWHGRVLLKRERYTKSAGGLIIPEDIQRSHSRARGEILAVGLQCTDHCKGMIGKAILFGVHAGAWLDANGVETDDEKADFFVCNEDDILGDVNE